MKDSKGHGSDPRGAHAAGVNTIGHPVTDRVVVKPSFENHYVKVGDTNGKLQVLPDKSAFLSGVMTAAGRRGEGSGTAFMNHIGQFADQRGLTVTLEPKTYGSGSKRLDQSTLIEFYKNHGFAPDASDATLMHRVPKGGVLK